MAVNPCLPVSNPGSSGPVPISQDPLSSDQQLPNLSDGCNKNRGVCYGHVRPWTGTSNGALIIPAHQWDSNYQKTYSDQAIRSSMERRIPGRDTHYSLRSYSDYWCRDYRFTSWCLHSGWRRGSIYSNPCQMPKLLCVLSQGESNCLHSQSDPVHSCTVCMCVAF